MPPPEEEWDAHPIHPQSITKTKPPDVHRRSHSRMVMPRIEVPPFKRPRSDYRPLPAAQSSIVNKRRVPSGPPSMAQVLQASFQYNADVEVSFCDGLEKKKRKLTKKNGEGEAIAVAVPKPTPNPISKSLPGPRPARNPDSFMQRTTPRQMSLRCA